MHPVATHLGLLSRGGRQQELWGLRQPTHGPCGGTPNPHVPRISFLWNIEDSVFEFLG